MHTLHRHSVGGVESRTWGLCYPFLLQASPWASMAHPATISVVVENISISRWCARYWPTLDTDRRVGIFLTPYSLQVVVNTVAKAVANAGQQADGVTRHTLQVLYSQLSA